MIGLLKCDTIMHSVATAYIWPINRISCLTPAVVATAEAVQSYLSGAAAMTVLLLAFLFGCVAVLLLKFSNVHFYVKSIEGDN